MSAVTTPIADLYFGLCRLSTIELLPLLYFPFPLCTGFTHTHTRYTHFYWPATTDETAQGQPHQQEQHPEEISAIFFFKKSYFSTICTLLCTLTFNVLSRLTEARNGAPSCSCHATSRAPIRSSYVMSCPESQNE